MKKSFVLVLLSCSPILASSFQANCSNGGCSGSYTGSTSFNFGFDFPTERASAEASDPAFPYNPYFNVGIGTSGGGFSSAYGMCDYDVILGGGTCDGEIAFGVYAGPPEATGLAPGTVVTVKGRGLGTATGTFCYGSSCPPSGPPPPLFNLNITGAYQFTLTDPGTLYPFTFTGGQFSSTPEPETFAFALVGLLGLLAIHVRRRYLEI